LNTLVRSIYRIIQVTSAKIRQFEKAKNQYIWQEFKVLWNVRSQFLYLKKQATVNSKTCSKYKYIFFPLQTEPEVALHGIAQDFFFQLSAINLLSRDLPANYYIIVKEHLYAVGRRPLNFYEQIKALKNVLIADPNDYGLDYVKNATAVASITGTSAWEAAALGIPVITFSKNNAFNFLNHVYLVSNPDSTKTLIPKILNSKWPNKKSKEDGAKFYYSYMQNSFNIGKNHEFISWKESKKNNKILEETAMFLIKKLFQKNKIHI